MKPFSKVKLSSSIPSPPPQWSQLPFPLRSEHVTDTRWVLAMDSEAVPLAVRLGCDDTEVLQSSSTETKSQSSQMLDILALGTDAFSAPIPRKQSQKEARRYQIPEPLPQQIPETRNQAWSSSKNEKKVLQIEWRNGNS